MPGGGDRVADALLVAVHLCGVDVAVADLEGVAHGGGCFVRGDLEDAEPELGDGRLVVELEGGDSHTGSNTAGLLLFRPAGNRSRGTFVVPSEQT